MLHAVYRLGGPDAVRVVGIGIAVKGLELATLFPSQSVTKVVERVPLYIIGNGYNIIIPDDIGKINGLYKIFCRTMIKNSAPQMKCGENDF